MATTTITEQLANTVITTVAADSPRRMKVDGTDPTFNDWRDDLVRDGYAVVKGAIPSERAGIYADKMLALMESL